MKIYVVDNGGQWTHREWRVLKSLDVDSEIISNSADFLSIGDADGWVLSGGAPSIIGEIPKLGKISEILDNTNVPVFGICVGAQFMALHHGGEVRKAPVPEFGKTMVTFIDTGSIFDGVPNNITVWENHNDEIVSLPGIYKLCASSRNCSVQAFYAKERPFIGVQFHPEVEHTMYGKEIFKSFINLCKR